MKLILRADVENLGNLGDVVTVRPGYGRNFLLPQGLAMVASEANLKVFELERKKLQERMDALRADAQAVCARLEALEELLLSLGSRVRIVIWAKFQFDLDTLESQLPPEETVVLRAGIPPEEQEKILSAFRSERRILVASVKLSRCPLDLNAADVVIFYNNTFSYAERVRADFQKVRDPVGEGAGLARTGTGNNHDGSLGVFGGRPLLRVQSI